MIGRKIPEVAISVCANTMLAPITSPRALGLDSFSVAHAGLSEEVT